MSDGRLMRAVHAAALAFSFVFLFAVVALAQGRADRSPHGDPGKFDFYVLSLSWSPSYCEASQERGDGYGRRSDPQCGGRPFSFVVHGLWPQYERGFPAFCQVPAPRLPRSIMESMLDLMPSPRLVYHEWDRHGTCSGLAAQSFFDTVRKARAAVKIPVAYQDVASPLTVSGDEVAEAFVKANPNLPRDAISVACSRNRLSEVRICMTKDLAFRDCAEVAHRSCRREHLAMPAMRGGNSESR
jgi:ribonuclease T2